MVAFLMMLVICLYMMYIFAEMFAIMVWPILKELGKFAIRVSLWGFEQLFPKDGRKRKQE